MNQCILCDKEIPKGHKWCAECRADLKEQMVYDYMDGMTFAEIGIKHDVPSRVPREWLHGWEFRNQGLFFIMGMDVSNSNSYCRTVDDDVHTRINRPRRRIENTLEKCRRDAERRREEEEPESDDRKGIIPISRGLRIYR